MGDHRLKTIVVLGNGRSATSLTAKTLSHWIPMGQRFHPGDDNNPLGYYEDIEIVRLNDAILKRAGGTWDQPPTLTRIMAQAPTFDTYIRENIERRNSDDIWGMKDPRLTLTAPLWHPHLRNPIYVAHLRNPKQVADSLARAFPQRNRDWQALVAEYNRRLLQFLSAVAEARPCHSSTP